MHPRALLAGACALSALAAPIIVPPYTLGLLIAAVVAIEFSPFLALIALAALVIALRSAPSRERTTTSILLAATFVTSALPVATLLATYHAPAQRNTTPVHAAISTRQIPFMLGTQAAQIRAFLPQSSGLHPIVIAIYGGAFQRGDPSKNADLNRDLAARGYAVFAIDYRHAPAYRFPTQLDDVNRQIAYITAHARDFSADATRIAIVGHSSGGALGMLAAFAPGAKVRAVVSYDGGIDMAGGVKNPPRPDPAGIPRIVTDYLGARPEEAPEAYRAASPIDRVRAGTAPVLLLYGARDHLIDVRAARALRDKLRALGNTITYVEFPWAEHAYEEVPFGLHGGVALRAVEAFLAENL